MSRWTHCRRGLMQTRWMHWYGLLLLLSLDSHTGTRNLDLHVTKFAAKSIRSISGLRKSPAPPSGFMQDMSRCFFPREKASDTISHLQGIISEKEKARQYCSSKNATTSERCHWHTADAVSWSRGHGTLGANLASMAEPKRRKRRAFKGGAHAPAMCFLNSAMFVVQASTNAALALSSIWISSEDLWSREGSCRACASRYVWHHLIHPEELLYADTLTCRLDMI